MNKKNKVKDHKDSDGSWVDDIIKNKMKPYDLAQTCMLKGGGSYGILEAIKNTQERTASYEYFIGKLIQILDTIPMPLIVHNKSFHIMRANKAYLKLVKKKCNKVVGKYYGEIFPFDDVKSPKCVCKLPRRVEYKGKHFKIHSFPMESPTLGCYQASLHIFEDITSQIKTEGVLTKVEHALSESLIKTVKVLAQTLEKRDPYTSGHQKRVAQLAVAIAQEMGMPEEKLLTIRLGGLIHDIGKVFIPSDILNKTGKLSKAEMALVRVHPDVGYKIIKDIKFPWPIKKILLQHHERLNGSGYPKGLRDKKIAIEAKIITVADVVEAMSSHRPYRPALGIDRALEEIKKNKNKLYDAKVVEACVRLFKRKKFKFEG